MKKNKAMEEPEKLREDFHRRVERLRGQVRELKEFLGDRDETSRGSRDPTSEESLRA